MNVLVATQSAFLEGGLMQEFIRKCDVLSHFQVQPVSLQGRPFPQSELGKSLVVFGQSGEFRQLSGREIALKLKDDEASGPPIIEFLLFGPQSCFGEKT